MRKGHTLLELLIVLAIVGICLLVGVPRVAGFLDWVAADGAAHDVSIALAVAREAAVEQGVTARLLIAAESLVVEVRDTSGWMLWRRFPGPAARGVTLKVSNPEVVFSPLGAGWGASNTTITLERGGREERITTSRLGRVKRW